MPYSCIAIALVLLALGLRFYCTEFGIATEMMYVTMMRYKSMLHSTTSLPLPLDPPESRLGEVINSLANYGCKFHLD